jgi:hypothetical protein
MKWFRVAFCDLEEYVQDETNETIYEQLEKKVNYRPYA